MPMTSYLVLLHPSPKSAVEHDVFASPKVVVKDAGVWCNVAGSQNRIFFPAHRVIEIVETHTEETVLKAVDA